MTQSTLHNQCGLRKWPALLRVYVCFSLALQHLPLLNLERVPISKSADLFSWLTREMFKEKSRSVKSAGQTILHSTVVDWVITVVSCEMERHEEDARPMKL
jgi:hypothetical protein